MKKFALAAADFNDLLVAQIMTRNQSFCHGSGIFLKARREMQRVFIILIVCRRCRVEGNIEDVPAAPAKSESNISAWNLSGFVSRWPKQIAVDGHVQYLHECRNCGRAANRAPAFFMRITVFHGKLVSLLIKLF
jgi:hypothetical protein